MDHYPKMLYKAPGSEPIHGGLFATLTVENERQEQDAIAEGWRESTPEALKASEERKAAAAAEAQRLADEKQPTRDELEAKATELGIDFSARVSDKKLREAIEAKLQAAAAAK
jgi:hypothetical protein